MDPVFGIMLDVARIVSFQPTVAGAETRRIERERATRFTNPPAADQPAPAVTRIAATESARFPKWLKLTFTFR
ncbi:MAG: hypothetical protein R3D05_14930 [Dongiaceae bacterium]